MASLGILQAAFAFGMISLLWRLCRSYLRMSHLDNIPGPPSSSLWKGNVGSIFHRQGWSFHDKICNEYGPIVKLSGMLNSRVLYVYDPVALYHIVVKDQSIYEEPHWFIASSQLIFGPGLLATLGDRHRKQRKLLNPLFSIKHLREVTPIFYKTIHRLRSAITAQTATGVQNEIDILGWMNRTALELIGQGGLGYSFDALVEDTPNDFGEAIKELVPTAWALTPWRMLSHILIKIGTPKFRRRIVELLPDKTIQKAKAIIDTLETRSKQILLEKKLALANGDKAILQQVGEGRDIMSILLRENMAAAEEDRLSEEEVLAQISTFVFAATDTTSTATARILHLLAQHPDVQDKLREEITTARKGQDIPYDQLIELPYLDAVCRETLRVYPPAGIEARETHQDVVMPLSEPIRGIDGTLIKEIPIPRNTYVIVSIRGCNRNNAIWGEDACEWKPERWLSPLPDTVVKAKIPGVYSHLMTFGGGSRACIGFKFSQLEMKVLLSVLLESFKFSLSNKDITWNFASPAYPTVGTESKKASLPLIVKAILTKA